MEKKEDSNMIISQYVLAVKEIKNAIIDSRYRAARSVNKEVLELNYSIGRFISQNSRNAQWGFKCYCCYIQDASARVAWS